ATARPDLHAMSSRGRGNPERVDGPDVEHVELHRDRHIFVHGAIGRQYTHAHRHGDRYGEWNHPFRRLGYWYVDCLGWHGMQRCDGRQFHYDSALKALGVRTIRCDRRPT